MSEPKVDAKPVVVVAEKPAGGDKPKADVPKVKKGKVEQLMSDLLIGGSVGAVSKTVMAPVERVKLLLQTQDSNPDVISGKVE